ncbi:putative peptidyl-tRNA hydrolase PTRHD1 [Phoenix dactylifera]|uniref:peptidyl-tRNA hydrolase n=1 Tax=Phoenix dactylifera TaxID=42345 RepID=A0A8B7BMX0_PHODC|nr:putative peptidyl-tRNA hydrolase PTRHD1 [Phoenix dactylifera]
MRTAFPLPVRLAFYTPSSAGLRIYFPPRSYSGPLVRVSNLNFVKKMSTSTEAAATAGEPAPPSDGGGEQGDAIVQYVVLRRDLVDTWPLGSIVSQGCHASVAAIWSHRDHPDTAAYCSESNIDSMHKVTLEVKGETQLRNLSEKLEAGRIEHKLWIEQPENIPTCLATRPYPKSQVASSFKKLKLCK